MEAKTWDSNNIMQLELYSDINPNRKITLYTIVKIRHHQNMVIINLDNLQEFIQWVLSHNETVIGPFIEDTHIRFESLSFVEFYS